MLTSYANASNSLHPQALEGEEDTNASAAVELAEDCLIEDEIKHLQDSVAKARAQLRSVKKRVARCNARRLVPSFATAPCRH